MFKLEIKIGQVELKPVIIERKFGSIKSATQYVRRHKIQRYKVKCNDEYVTFFGSKMITLSQAKAIVEKLERSL